MNHHSLVYARAKTYLDKQAAILSLGQNYAAYPVWDLASETASRRGIFSLKYMHLNLAPDRWIREFEDGCGMLECLPILQGTNTNEQPLRGREAACETAITSTTSKSDDAGKSFVTNKNFSKPKT